ncbi:MAG TPA: hypothetical protein VE131_04430 [Terriglobales bacterium]|nr:hypothetical protein [Terriglobales bacterium]
MSDDQPDSTGKSCWGSLEASGLRRTLGDHESGRSRSVRGVAQGEGYAVAHESTIEAKATAVFAISG